MYLLSFFYIIFFGQIMHYLNILQVHKKVQQNKKLIL